MSKIKDFVICVIFEHNFDEYKGAGVRGTPLRSRSTDRDDSRDPKMCRRAVARQAFSTQQSAKFAEKTCEISYVDRFSAL